MWLHPLGGVRAALRQLLLPGSPSSRILLSLSSLQNVLLQMGLHVLAVNGRLIRQARSYILRCHGCFK